jgi:hypothetical protein
MVLAGQLERSASRADACRIHEGARENVEGAFLTGLEPHAIRTLSRG